jgi:pimeloyl-ACP methyl ester carboxylesterase
MPSPNLIAASLARRTSRAALCVIGNSIAGYNPPIRVAEEFAMLELAELLFHDPERGQALLTGGADLSDLEALKEFYLGSQRRLAMAGKILFPIPNRRLAKRLYRLAAETLLVWGTADRLIVPAYAARWQALIPGARLAMLEGAAHMLPYEQPEAFARTLTGFLA